MERECECEIGDRVTIKSCEGFAGPAVVVGTRDTPGARYKVRLDDGSQPDLWAHDFEVEPVDPPKVGYDSRPDTREHIRTVRKFLNLIIDDLMCRASEHDASKLLSPEVEVFDEFTPKLKGSTYGSEEYKQFLAAMQLGLDHHYASNSHHPEHWPKPTGEHIEQLRSDVAWLEEMQPLREHAEIHGRLVARLKTDLTTAESRINGMSLIDLTEMLVDWLAATRRHADGDIRRSIEINQKRFGYSDELKQIFLNTLLLIE